MTSGQLSQFLVYAAIVATSAAALTEMWGEMQRAAGAMERLAELLRGAARNHGAGASRRRCRRGCAAISRFEHVSFRYPSRPDTLALDDLHARR